MLKETIQLEKLRQQIEDVENEIGSQSDFIDFTRPNEQKKNEVRQAIAKMESQSKQLNAELHELIVTTRREKPQAFEEWVNTHKAILERIVAENQADNKAGVRHNTARGTLNQWEKVCAGKRDYVGINWHYLKDYKDEVRKVFNQGSWKFWK